MQAGEGQVDGRASGTTPVASPPRLEFDELIARLSERKHAFTRYQVLDEIGRGGMGRVLRVHDVDLHRELAMKVLRHGDASLLDPKTSSDRLQLHVRFLEEAQVASQLDHPGIVPVHDIGLDARGCIYFTMKLVRGRTLQQVIELAERGEENWSLTRVLNVLLRVCEAMGYAHERGVLHRDLKPGNVMVGRHGEVYVMDWGLARLVDRPDLGPTSADHDQNGIRSARRGAPESDAFSAFLTEDGRVLGTPAYMSPEQASGDSELVTAASDVYSVGAILYQALVGFAPYSTHRKQRIENRAVWLQLQSGPPRKVTEFRGDLAPELVAICEKAMERDVARRYASMTELADDLRAYLELRVVRAYRSGPFTELRKWIARNRASASLLLLLVLVVAGAGFIGAWQERIRTRDLSLRADAQRAATSMDRARELWPVDPDRAPRMQQWILEARALLATADARQSELAEFEAAGLARGMARPQSIGPDLMLEENVQKAERLAQDMQSLLVNEYSDRRRPEAAGEALESWVSGRAVLPREIEWWKSRADALRDLRAPAEILRFDDPADEDQHALLLALRRDHARIRRELALVEARHRQASRLRARTIDAELEAWNRAIASIRDEEQCPEYEGLVIQPQLGLVPLRRDDRSGLWEFWHVLSGERPLVDGEGRCAIDGDTGIVLVLIPGGKALAGASVDPAAQRHDPAARPTERLRTARLQPFFMSKYELTQGQWLAMTGEMPSLFFPGKDLVDSPRVTRSHPVESVDWHDAARLVARFGLVLPTEMQWEWAARAHSELPYGERAEFDSARPCASFADDAYSIWTKGRIATPAGRDGSRIHLPVDSFEPNRFGLYCVMGNVAEWCRDAYADTNDALEPHGPDGEVTSGSLESRVSRGGSFRDIPFALRLSARRSTRANERLDDLGIRPARPLDR